MKQQDNIYGIFESKPVVKEVPYWIGSLTLEYGVVGSIPGQAVSGSFVQYPLLSVRPRLKWVHRGMRMPFVTVVSITNNYSRCKKKKKKQKNITREVPYGLVMSRSHSLFLSLSCYKKGPKFARICPNITRTSSAFQAFMFYGGGGGRPA